MSDFDEMFGLYREADEHDENDARFGWHLRDNEVHWLKQRADTMAETIREIRDLVTYGAETKTSFIMRVRAILSADPDERVRAQAIANKSRDEDLPPDGAYEDYLINGRTA